jgi:DNA-binding transcriptional MerR regulator
VKVAKQLDAAGADIPNKLYFRIGEVSRLAGVKPYVLRFWESEFPALNPKKSGSGHRLYRRKDVELVLEIKRLLYGNRFTIEGARKALESKASEPKAPLQPAAQPRLFDTGPTGLDRIRRELADILQLLQDRSPLKS